ncbi:MAG: hypothetical protein KH334_00060 [Clostridiales bacterium]|nr:hypothetical protein [Clostridiales bacterium]
MSDRLNVNNPFYDVNASASAFGWQFQVDVAIFLFLYYIDEVDKIVVEGKYQDIELLCKNNKHIYAQAKSIHNGSLDNRNSKLEDAIISLVKTPADSSKGDELLYISNYEVPITRTEIFKNKVVKLKNVSDEKTEFNKQLQRIINKLEDSITKNPEQKKTKYQELIGRIKAIDVDNFMVSAIYPYINAENPHDVFREIENKINEILTIKFDIQSPYLQRFVQKLLREWHETFLVNATTPNEKKYKQMSKEELLWQIVVILSEINIDISDLFDNEIDPDYRDEYEMCYSRRSYYHERFSFFNKLIEKLKEYIKANTGKTRKDFIKEHWQDYIDEYVEFADYPERAKEYLIKKCLARLINNKNNIQKIVEGR